MEARTLRMDLLLPKEVEHRRLAALGVAVKSERVEQDWEETSVSSHSPPSFSPPALVLQLSLDWDLKTEGPLANRRRD